MADEVLDVAEALDLQVAADLDAARARDAAQVVACQVDEHHVLGALLAIGEQGPWRELIVGSGRGAARPRAGDGVGQEPLPSTRRRSSGLAPTTSKSGMRTKNRYGLGLTRRSAR